MKYTTTIMLLISIYFIMFCCFLNFSLQKHFIVLLLSLELMLVTMFTMLVFKQLFLLGLIFLSLGACEGALGLSLLVSMSNIKNKYFLNSYFMSKC